MWGFDRDFDRCLMEERKGVLRWWGDMWESRVFIWGVDSSGLA